MMMFHGIECMTAEDLLPQNNKGTTKENMADNSNRVKKTSNKYDFKRSFYFDVEKSIEDNSITFILGARKCGKTVCMKQLEVELPNAEYYDAKQMSDDDTVDLIDEIADCIKNNEKRVFLVDEATYLLRPEQAIAKIANAFTDCKNTNTKVVFTGSQSVALEAWASRAFAGNAMSIYADFLSYPEWLAYKKIDEVSESTYNQFILGTREFYSDFVSLDMYLKGCLEETIQSNYKTSNVIFHNNCDALNERILKNVLYAALVAQADRRTLQNFFDRDGLLKKIHSSLKEAYSAVGGDTLRNRIDDILSERIIGYSSTDFETLKQSYIFLQKCGLVTLTYVSSETHNFENIVDVSNDLCKWDENKIKNKNELFSRVNICIKYPMFYAEILKEVLGEHFPSAIKGDILGGIVECQVRGLLSQWDCYEYHGMCREGELQKEHEVDYVNFARQEAVEISVRNKEKKDVHFDDLPKTFTKILLTKDQDYTQTDGLIKVPYYKFIFEHSVGRELLLNKGSEISHKSTQPKTKFDRTDD